MVEITFLEFLALMAFVVLMCLMMLLAVGLGAYAVFRTRRDDSFIGFPSKSVGDVSVAQGEEVFYDPDPTKDESEPPDGGDVGKILERMAPRTSRFLGTLGQH